MVDSVGAVPMPINLTTINKLYGKNMTLPGELDEFLHTLRVPVQNPRSAREHLESIYGKELTELFFARYTKKMWGLSLDDMHRSVVARIPIRKDDNPYYFNDKLQAMPKKGYTLLFEKMLDHENIEVRLNEEFEKKMEKDYSHVFNSMPVDEYFDYQFGELPYRSIKFEHRFKEAFESEVPTLNFTDESIYTRKTSWDNYPGCGGGSGMVTYEVPCDYKSNGFERYYPVKSMDGEPQRIYSKYKIKADGLEAMTFVGRCGQYIYYDMHQVVANSLKLASSFLSKTV